MWDFFDSFVAVYNYQIHTDASVFHFIGSNPKELFYSEMNLTSLIIKLLGINFGLFAIIFFQKLIAFYGAFLLLQSLQKEL